MNLTDALRIGISGMQYSQAGLGVVSHNVVNANTEGYSRQVIQSSSVSIGGQQNGVQISSVQRITDKFVIDRQLKSNADLSYAQTKLTYLSSLETTISGTSVTGGGLDSVLSGLFTAFSQLANNPGDSALKANVVQQAQLTATTLNSVSAQLDATASETDSVINDELSKANQLLKDISSLNGQIALNTSANDLMDSRDKKIDELSKLISINVTTESSSGTVRITLENGRKLVDGVSYSQFTRSASGGPFAEIAVQSVKTDGTLSPTITAINMDDVSGGKLKALVDVRDEVIPNLRAQLDEFTDTFTTRVNEITSAGTNYPGQTTLNSGNTSAVSTAVSDIYTEVSSALAGQSFHLSVVNSLGNPVSTTVGNAAIALPDLATYAAAPYNGVYSLTDLANAINNDPNVGNAALGGTDGVIASVVADGQGQPMLQITAANSNYKVVMSDAGGGNVLSILGMNNLFGGGTSAGSVAVASKFVANSDLLPTALMRSADGGVSSMDNQTISLLAQMADEELGFAAAGGIGTQTDTAVGYLGQISSNLAVQVSNANDRQTYNQELNDQLSELATSTSGVNMNEELSQMLVFQNSFQASSRVITMVNDLMQELMQII